MAEETAPAVLELEYAHDCWCIDATERAGGGVIRGLGEGKPHRGSVSGVFRVEAENPDELVAILKRDPRVREIIPLQKTSDSATVIIRHKADTLIAEAISQTRCIPMWPSTTSGTDSIAVLAPKQEYARELGSLLNERCTTHRLLSKIRLRGNAGFPSLAEFMKLGVLSSQLSEKQKVIFSLARKNGYYEAPRRTTIEEIASIAGVHKATAAEHLRKAENKLLSFVGQLVLK